MKELQTLEHINYPKCQFTKQSLIIDPTISYEEWVKIGKFLSTVEGVCSLWRGDWLNFGEHSYEEWTQEFDPHNDTTRHALWNSKSIATRVPPSRRRESINPSVYGEIAYLDETQQEEIMDIVEEKHLTIKDIRELVKESKKLPTPELPKDKFDLIYADPPWEYGQEQHGKEKQETVLETHYPTMPTEEICQLPIKDLSADNAVLFIWTTSPKIFEAKQVIDAWGFEYKSSMIWDKVKHNVGYYVSVRHEFLLIATKGSFLPTSGKLIDSVQTIERTEHSKKPQRFREIIEEMYPDTKKIELFARTVPDGWTAWGNEIN